MDRRLSAPQTPFESLYHRFTEKSSVKYLLGKPQGRSVGRARRRWEDTIKVYEIEGYELEFTASGKGAVAASFEHGNAHSSSINGWEFLQWISKY